MSDELLEILPVPQRLALSYAPASSRPAFLSLFALDARLGSAVRQANEPIMAQMRLAWWRDQLRLEEKKRERSDEVVVALDRLSGMRRALFGLIDGWEILLGEDLNQTTLRDFTEARGKAFAALSELLRSGDNAENVALSGMHWACADLLQGLSQPNERAIALHLSKELGPRSSRLSKPMRPLAVLDGLARRCLSKGGEPILSGPASGIMAMRLGLFGR